MISSDLIVEVRDAHLNRVGVIFPRDMTCNINPVSNDLGTWTVTVSTTHACADALSTPGSGIVATDITTGAVILSGPATQIEYDEDTSSGGDVTKVTVSGTGDNIYLQDRLAWSDPMSTQISATDGEMLDAENMYDEQTGPSETLIHHYVDVNMGPSSSAIRRLAGLAMGANGARGAPLTAQPRYQDLLSLCQTLAAPDGLTFRIQQAGSNLLFETREVADVSADVRFSVRTKHLSSTSAQLQPPTITRAIVSASDLYVDYYLYGSTDSLNAEQTWSRRIEQFVSADSNDPDTIAAAGKTPLADGGSTKFSAQIVTPDHDALRYGVDYQLGDTVTVEVNGTEIQAPVTGFVIQIDDSGKFTAGVTVGDPTSFDTTLSMINGLNRNMQRINALAVRPAIIAANGTAASSTQTKSFSFSAASNVWVCNHNLGTLNVDVITTDSDGTQVIGDVYYDSPNQCSVHWFSPRTGTAVVSG